MKGPLICGALLAVLVVGTLAAQTPPPNDNFTNAILLTGNQVSFSGTLSNATIEADEPYLSPEQTGSVWWKWTPTTTGPVLLQVTPNNPSGGRVNAWLQVFREWSFSYLEGLGETTLDIPAGRFLIQSLYVPTNTYYYFRISGAWQGSFTAQLTASAQPVILQQPESCEVSPQGSAVFSALATGLPAPTYQWMFNNTPLPGQTAAMLFLHNIRTNSAGAYSVIASNSGGAAASATAWLTVRATNPIPRVTMLPPTNGPDARFIVQGEVGRWYRFETTQDLSDWWLGDWAWYGRATNEYNLFSVPTLDGEHQFVNVALNATTDGCVAQLKAMHTAIHFFTLENHLPSWDTYSLEDLGHFFRGGIVPPCPGHGSYVSGGCVTNDATCTLGDVPPPYARGHRWP